MEEDKQAKVELYEKFLNEKLKIDLGRCLNEQEKMNKSTLSKQ